LRHIITALVENQPGVLARVVGLISGRGFNIHSLNVAPTHDSTLSRVTLAIDGDERDLEQITKQLNKLIDVIKVADLTRSKYVNRELALIEVNCDTRNRSEIIELAHLFEARIISVRKNSVVMYIVSVYERIDEFIEVLRPYGIVDISRSGVVAMGRIEQE
jgi:acetolactate synthase-1/3 small subunit